MLKYQLSPETKSPETSVCAGFFNSRKEGAQLTGKKVQRKRGGLVDDIRCKCGKIVCQMQNQSVLIKCRHCKRFVIMEFYKPEGQVDSSPENYRLKIEYK